MYYRNDEELNTAKVIADAALKFGGLQIMNAVIAMLGGMEPYVAKDVEKEAPVDKASK